MPPGPLQLATLDTGHLAQELMRHSDIRLTMNVYTHLHLADTAGAVEALPRIRLAQSDASRPMTGTDS